MRSSLVEYLLKENEGRGREEGLLEEKEGDKEEEEPIYTRNHVAEYKGRVWHSTIE